MSGIFARLFVRKGNRWKDQTGGRRPLKFCFSNFASLRGKSMVSVLRSTLMNDCRGLCPAGGHRLGRYFRWPHPQPEAPASTPASR